MADTREILDKVDLLSRTPIQPDTPPLSDREVQEAKTNLVSKPWRSLTRQTVDPPILGQSFGLFSFAAASDSTREKYGVFGTVKLRGNYATEEDANAAAEEIIRSVDSSNHILICRVGQAVPLTTEIKYTDNIKTIDLNNAVSDVDAQQRKLQEEKNRRAVEDVKKREQALLDRNQNPDIPEETHPLQKYCLLQAKRAHLEMRLDDEKTIINDKIQPALRAVKREIHAMDISDPEFKNQYKEQILSARREVGIKDNADHAWEGQGKFLNYL